LRIDNLTQSSLNTVSCHHRFFVDTSNSYRRLLDKDQNIRCMLCCDADARSALEIIMVVGRGDNHIPAILGTAFLPSLLVLVLVSHCDFSLQDMFRIVRLMVCCHKGRDSKMHEVRALRQILPFCDLLSHFMTGDDLEYGTIRSQWTVLR
jgi:hypothetical protein